jgi:RHS repeat-associated protein
VGKLLIVIGYWLIVIGQQLTSTIGLVDGSGQEVAEFRYDSFGNLRSGSSALPGNLGGDFRFQGQWLDGATGLYHMRARYYDPQTGRFVSRDPVDLVEMEPESGNLYQFAYGNPQIYSDPSGAITVAELNSGLNLQSLLQTTRSYVGQEAKDYLIDSAQGVINDLALSALRAYTPFDPDSIWNAISETNPEIRAKKGGNKFQAESSKGLIDLFEKDQGFLDNIYIEVPIDPWNGKPSGNGTNIRDYFLFENGYSDFDFERFGGNPKHPRPDFVIRPDLPKKTSVDSWLVGDIKLSVNTIAQSYFDGGRQKDQFEAIANHAANYGSRIAGFLTLYPGTSASREKIRKAFFPYGVVAVVVSLTDK